MAENVTFSVTVNGEPHTVTADSTLPLLWMLRDVIGLTGTKYGRGITQRKACSVLVNGVLERSCDFDAKNAAGKSVTTVEGLSPDLTNRLQAAWIAEQVPQCGYCQSGMLMAATDLLTKIKILITLNLLGLFCSSFSIVTSIVLGRRLLWFVLAGVGIVVNLLSLVYAREELKLAADDAA